MGKIKVVEQMGFLNVEIQVVGNDNDDLNEKTDKICRALKKVLDEGENGAVQYDFDFQEMGDYE